MSDVHFEIIRLEDIGRDVFKTEKHAHQHYYRSIQKLSDTDVENLNHYLRNYNHESTKTYHDEKIRQEHQADLNTSNAKERASTPNYVDITEDFYSSKGYTGFNDRTFDHLPAHDILSYHHHHHHHHHRHHHHQQQTSPSDAKENQNGLLKSINNQQSPIFSLDIATCGMKKNSRLPVPHENFSLADGCFGDDAGFTTGIHRKNFLGISDGAGGNVMYGFNPRLFSESLMRNCADLAHTGHYSTTEPKRLLCHAFDRVQDENCFGSATACVLGIDSHTGLLNSVNIGDSGYVVLRHGNVIYRSRSQKMNGDCPRQLDVYPWTAALKKKGLNYTQISSLDAICQRFQLELGDIIILSTDGLFDNVPARLIERILASNRSLKSAANELVNHAVRFYIKPDDILVILARILPSKNKSKVEK